MVYGEVQKSTKSACDFDIHDSTHDAIGCIGLVDSEEKMEPIPLEPFWETKSRGLWALQI